MNAAKRSGLKMSASKKSGMKQRQQASWKHLALNWDDEFTEVLAMASVLHAQEQLFNDEQLPAEEEADEDAHEVGLWDEDNDEPDEADEAYAPVFTC
eukprot:403094-Amphidinium_carterae.1